MSAIRIGNSQYEHILWYSTDWYTSDFISGFAAMVQHDTHISTPIYKNSDRALMVFTPYPNHIVTRCILFLLCGIVKIMQYCIRILINAL